MRELLEGLSKEEIIDFFVEYAGKDAKFTNAINVRFREPDFVEELQKIENIIDHELIGASDYYDHDSWGNIVFSVSSVYSEIRDRTEQGHIRLAFSEAELLYRKLLEVFEYQGECEVSDEAECCLEIMSDIADKAVLDEDKKFIFNICIELANLQDGKDYGADYEDKLLRISAKFVTQENRKELELAVESYKRGWRAQEFAVVCYEIISKLDGGEAGDNYIAENMSFPKIREIAFDRSVLNKNYVEAERLCVQALLDEKQPYGISPWLYRLYSLYELANNMEKMEETSETLLLNGDLTYYDKLKAFRVKRGAWEAYYPELLEKCKLELYTGKYMQILEKEREYALLLDQVKEHKAEIHNYGMLLTEKYPLEIWEIFSEQINKEADSASQRDMYRNVCLRIKRFAEAGYEAKAVGLIDDLRMKYKRKPAFVDELSKVFNEYSE